MVNSASPILNIQNIQKAQSKPCPLAKRVNANLIRYMLFILPVRAARRQVAGIFTLIGSQLFTEN